MDIHSKNLKKNVDVEFVYPYFTMSTDENNCLSHLILITLNNFKRILLNNMHTHRDHDGHGHTPALASQQCKNNNTVQWLVPVITLVATTSNDHEPGGQTQLHLTSPFVAAAVLKAYLNSCRFLALPLVNLNNFWIYPAKKQKMTYLLMVPTVMKNGPR